MKNSQEGYDPERDGEQLQKLNTAKLVEKFNTDEAGFSFEPTWHIFNIDTNDKKTDSDYIRSATEMAMSKHLKLEIQRKALVPSMIDDGKEVYRCRKNGCP